MMFTPPFINPPFFRRYPTPRYNYTNQIPHFPQSEEKVIHSDVSPSKTASIVDKNPTENSDTRNFSTRKSTSF